MGKRKPIPDFTRCAALTLAGPRCKFSPAPGQEFCPKHGGKTEREVAGEALWAEIRTWPRRSRFRAISGELRRRAEAVMRQRHSTSHVEHEPDGLDMLLGDLSAMLEPKCKSEGGAA